MAGFLFVSWGGAGNQVPALGIAAALRERGHDVTFAGYADQQDRFEAHGFGFRLLERAQLTWPTAPPEDWMPALVDAVWACDAHPDDLSDLAAEDGSGRYDALVVDCLMFGALGGAERLDVPTAVLVHSPPGALLPPGGGLDRLALGRVNQLRTDIGLPAVATLWDAWRPFRPLCTSISELDPPAGSVPPGVEFVGPAFEPAETGWSPPWPGDDRRPLVLVSFSSGIAWDQTSRIRRTVEALADGSRRILVTTGPFDVDDLAERPGVFVVPHVPHHQVLPRASATVTHAGHGTVAASLAHGVPIVALPNPAADQPALAARAAALGVGIALDGERATPGEIRDAVDAVVGDGVHAEQARRLATVIDCTPGATGTAERLERMTQPGVAPGRST